jgi:hypothetical protein
VAKNPFCFSLEESKYGAISLLGIAGSDLGKLNAAIAPLEQKDSCKQFINGGSFTGIKACPGFSLYGGPTAPVAPGAIQS